VDKMSELSVIGLMHRSRKVPASCFIIAAVTAALIIWFPARRPHKKDLLINFVTAVRDVDVFVSHFRAPAFGRIRELLWKYCRISVAGGVVSPPQVLVATNGSVVIEVEECEGCQTLLLCHEESFRSSWTCLLYKDGQWRGTNGPQVSSAQAERGEHYYLTNGVLTVPIQGGFPVLMLR
jgi:hypothetical protein